MLRSAFFIKPGQNTKEVSEGWETSWATQGTSRVHAALSNGRQQGTLDLLRPRETRSESYHTDFYIHIHKYAIFYSLAGKPGGRQRTILCGHASLLLL